LVAQPTVNGRLPATSAATRVNRFMDELLANLWQRHLSLAAPEE
jgi:hypothetical protein